MGHIRRSGRRVLLSVLLLAAICAVAGCRVRQNSPDDKAGDALYPALEAACMETFLTGTVDSYLYVPMDGRTYRYERTDEETDSLTRGELLYSFTEKSLEDETDFQVYALSEYPELSAVLVTAGGDFVRLYAACPPKAADPAFFDEAKAAGMIAMENGDAVSGVDTWAAFFEKTQKGKKAATEIVHYWTLGEPQQYDERYYEAHRVDYPQMFTLHLSYDGDIYSLRWEEWGKEYTREYKYLMKYEDTIPSVQSSKEPLSVIRYVLTNDNTVGWDDLMRGMISSQSGDYIAHFSVYVEKQ